MTNKTTTEQHAALGALLIDIMNDAPSAPVGVFADAPCQTDPVEPTAPRIPRLSQYETEYQSPHDLLTDRLYQAHGLSALLYGVGLESFQQMANDIQDGALWALHSLIHDAQIAANRLPRGAA